MVFCGSVDFFVCRAILKNTCIPRLYSGGLEPHSLILFEKYKIPVLKMEPSDSIHTSNPGTRYKGVGGFLFLFCLILTVFSPAATIVSLATISSDAQFQPEGLAVFMLIEIVISVLVMAYGFYAGVGLWTLRRNAIQTAKLYLVCYLWSRVLAAALPFVFGPPSMREGLALTQISRNAASAFVFFATWYCYLRFSKRVKATYVDLPSCPPGVRAGRYSMSAERTGFSDETNGSIWRRLHRAFRNVRGGLILGLGLLLGLVAVALLGKLVQETFSIDGDVKDLKTEFSNPHRGLVEIGQAQAKLTPSNAGPVKVAVKFEVRSKRELPMAVSCKVDIFDARGFHLGTQDTHSKSSLGDFGALESRSMFVTFELSRADAKSLDKVRIAVTPLRTAGEIEEDQERERRERSLRYEKERIEDERARVVAGKKWQSLVYGMSKEEVEEILGKPVSVRAGFGGETWEYRHQWNQLVRPSVDFNDIGLLKSWDSQIR
jgi:hypothetical protein